MLQEEILKDTFKNNKRDIVVMGRKKGRLDFWIFFTAIIGTSFLVFNKTLDDFLKLNSDFFMGLGIFLLIVSVVISLSKLWR